MPHKTQTKRIFGLDLIRVFASLFTIAGHFFSLHTQYMDTPFVGASMFVQGMAQMFFRGTPFFMLLSGECKVCSDFALFQIWKLQAAYAVVDIDNAILLC